MEISSFGWIFFQMDAANDDNFVNMILSFKCAYVRDCHSKGYLIHQYSWNVNHVI